MFTAKSPIRSRSLLIFMAATMNRRSMATGWCKARILRHSSSISTSRWSMSRSRCSTWWARFGVAFQKGPNGQMHLIFDDRT